jgi:hypothetical protein
MFSECSLQAATLMKGIKAQAATTLGVDAAAALQNLGRSKLR